MPSDVLIFEDLSNRGFVTEEPQNGLNLEQSSMSIEKLAFFHAASVIMLNEVSHNHNFFIFINNFQVSDCLEVLYQSVSRSTLSHHHHITHVSRELFIFDHKKVIDKNINE